MRAEIRGLHDRLKATTIYVTHDQIEAMTMADKIVVMCDGRIEQAGRPMDLYSNPANLFVATFLGSPEMNLLPGTRREAGLDLGEDGVVPIGAALPASAPAEITLGVRPHAIRIVPAGDAALSATVALVERTGAETVLTCALPSGRKVCVVGPAQVEAGNGERIGLAFDPSHLRCFDTQTGRALAT
jgi:multiple sugar transport system ATP-binding protein